MEESLHWRANTSEATAVGNHSTRNMAFVRLTGVACILLAYSTLSIFLAQEKKAQAHYVGWEPKFWPRLRFTSGAWPLIMDGYRRYKDSMFYICRHDRDILVMSNEYIDELRTFPED